ncbi:hypothetical protein A6A25_39565 [Saccharothrix sp. CB00851]|nr:hypothetical protein A6A25_39565 [Saccharothrix sp. CB00851]
MVTGFQRRDVVDHPDDVLALERRVAHVCLAAALAEAALVEADHAEARVEVPLDRSRFGGAGAAPAVDRHPVLRRGGGGLEDGEADVHRSGCQRFGFRHTGDADVVRIGGFRVRGRGNGDGHSGRGHERGECGQYAHRGPPS